MDRDIFVELLKNREYKGVRRMLEVMQAVDIASLLEELDNKDLAIAFRLIQKDEAAEVFANMNNELQAKLVESFTERELKELLSELYMDDTVDMLEELPANLVTRILEAVDREKRSQINALLKYPDDSAGSLMTTEYVDLKIGNTVAEALAHIKKTGIHKETIYTCYVLENRKLLGIVSAKDLMTMDDSAVMEELMEREIISVDTHADKEEVARLFSKYDLLALPVLDAGGLMVGIVTVDDAWDVAVEEATEDFTKMAAVVPTEKPYFAMSAMSHARHRIVWLLILMLSSTVTATMITHFEDAISVIPLLVASIPMLTDTGGNCGAQSSTLVIRGIVLDEIHLRDIFRVIWKEFCVSLIVSVILAVVNGIRLLIMYRDVRLALVVSISLVGTVIISKFIGCILPLFAKRVHLDPAIMAAPIITTLVDACSIWIYFSVATCMFSL